MAQNQQACLTGALVGAAVGAAVGYLYGTEDGVRRRAQIARLTDHLVVDADEAHRLWLRLREAWARFEDARSRPVARVRDPRSWPEDVA